jgi:hypothetical protein
LENTPSREWVKTGRIKPLPLMPVFETQNGITTHTTSKYSSEIHLILSTTPPSHVLTFEALQKWTNKNMRVGIT